MLFPPIHLDPILIFQISLCPQESMDAARQAEAVFLEKKAALAAELGQAKRDLQAALEKEDEEKAKKSLLRPKSKARRIIANAHEHLSTLAGLLSELDSELAARGSS